jgi:hypothetical protein
METIQAVFLLFRQQKSHKNFLRSSYKHSLDKKLLGPYSQHFIFFLTYEWVNKLKHLPLQAFAA